MTSPLIDTHVHLQDAALLTSLPDVLARADAAGIRAMLCNGCHSADWPIVADLANQHASIVPCFGVHPRYIDALPDDYLDTLHHFLTAHNAPVGEIGLDHLVDPRDESLQDRVFIDQWHLACQLDRPMSIHCLRAWGRLTELLADACQKSPDAGFVLHAYSGPADLIPTLAAHNAYFSFSGGALYANRRRAHDALRATPRDRLLVETDSPDLLPPGEHLRSTVTDDQGHLRNEPSNLAAIVEGLAQILDTPVATLTDQLHKNTVRIFGRFLPKTAL